MSKKRNDPRFERTESALRDTLMDIVAKKGFSAVKIEALCRAAGVNRATFYLHHRDKFELLEKCLLGFFDHVESAAEGRVAMDVESALPGLIRAAALNCFSRRDFILKILEDGRFPVFQALFMKRMSMEVELFIEQLQREGRRLSRSRREHQVMFLASAFFGAILNWIKSGTEEELDGFCRDLTEFAMKALIAAGDT